MSSYAVVARPAVYKSFGPFFREPADVVIARYFIAGDFHFTEVGNRLQCSEVKAAAGSSW
jgi:hypothetical protein